MDGQVDPYLRSSTSEDLSKMEVLAIMIRNVYHVMTHPWLVMRCK
jgi:hypothetical protein